MVVFIVSGFWHGANWTFIVWGAIHALLFLPLLLANNNRNYLDTVAAGKVFPSIKELAQILMTFSLVTMAWIFFRAENISVAISYIGNIFSPSLFSIPSGLPIKELMLVGVLLFVEWIQRDKQHALQLNGVKIPRLFRWGIYYMITLLIILMAGSQQEFIYFQF